MPASGDGDDGQATRACPEACPRAPLGCPVNGPGEASLDGILAAESARFAELDATPRQPIADLIEASSLGTPEAVAARSRVPSAVAKSIVDRVRIAGLTDERDLAREVAVTLEQDLSAVAALIGRVLDLVRAAEHDALHLQNPLVPPVWCGRVRAILDAPGRGCGCEACESAPERAARAGEAAGSKLESAWADPAWRAR